MIRTGLLIVAFGVGLVLAWQIAGTLLLLFSGLLLAAVIDAAVSGLGYILPIPRGFRLLIVTVIALAVFSALIVAGGYNAWRQVDALWELLAEGAARLFERLEEWGVPRESLAPPDGGVPAWLPDPEMMFGHAGTAFGMTMGVLSNAVIIVLLGLFLALDPKGYRDGVLALVRPERRDRIGEVLDKTGSILRWWLVGQLAMMILIGVSTTILLWVAGIQYAVLLGLVTGLLNFIPFLGPILAAIPLLLVLIPEGLATLFWVMTAFMILQWIEGYLINPFVQHKVVHLAPALSLSFLAVMAALFGGIGVALATPLLAVLRVLVLELYVGDVLGDRTPRL